MDEIVAKVLEEFKQTSEYGFIYRKMVSAGNISNETTKDDVAKAMEQLVDDACEIASYKYCLSLHKGEVLTDELIETIKNDAYNLAELLSCEVIKEYAKGDVD